MPKLPSFAIKDTEKGWRVRVPKSISDTGADQARFFPSRRLAEAFAKKLREDFRSHGEKASVLPPRVADDAAKAWLILEPLGITLTEAARKIKAQHDRAAASVPVAEALDAWSAACVAKGLRPETLKSYKETAVKIRETIGEDVLVSCDLGKLQAVLSGPSYDLHRRNASAFWHWCAKAPRRWCDAERFKDMETVSVRKDGDISVLSPRLVERLLRTAERYYPDTVPIYAIGFFGGPRVAERNRLTEGAVNEDGVEIGANIAKKHVRRHIPLNDTLAAWLEAYPFAPCADWADKDKAVRALAGWKVTARLLKKQPREHPLGPWPRNVIRHTHASAEIANGATLEDLLFRFGHTDGPETLRAHYVGRYTKKQAVEFWSIGPHSVPVPQIKTA